MHKIHSGILAIFTLFVFAAGLCVPSLSQEIGSVNALEKKADRLFAAWDRPDSPGCALGVIQNGQFLYKRGYGMANLEYDIPIGPESVFRIGSTSKQFTAMCIALLEEEGRISLNDSLKKYFPEMADYAETITLNHLLHHTSGVRDYLTLMELAGFRRDDFLTDPEVVDLIVRQKELNFAPGEEHLYSNSGYFLLAEIVKRVTGKSMRVYAQDKIFKPLGMVHTHYHNDHTEIVKNRASGYGREKSDAGWAYKINMTNLDMIGDGGVFTCVDDLFAWDQNFYDNKLGQGKQELIDKVQTVGHLKSGEALNYAFGLQISDYRGLKMVSHGGAFVGFRAEIVRFPEHQFSVIVLANFGSINPSRLARQVADIYLADALKPVAKKPDAARPSPKTRRTEPGEKTEPTLKTPQKLAAYTGEFYSEELGVSYHIFLEDGHLVFKLYFPHRSSPAMALEETAENEFALRGLTLNFIRVGDGPVTSFTLNAGRVKNIRFEKK